MNNPHIHILFIEDNPTDALLLKDTLSKDLLANYELEIAENLKDGLSFLKKHSSDIVLLDLGLPDSTGLETFLKIHKKFPDVPIVVISGSTDEKLAYDTIQAGAQDYLVKDIKGWALVSRAIRYSFERRQTQEKIALFKHSVDVHYDGAYWMDTDNNFMYINNAGCDALGYEYNELIGKNLAHVNPLASPEGMKMVWQILREKGVFASESLHKRKDGSVFPVELITKYIEYGGKEYACGFARDITERKRTEEAIRASEEKYRQIVTWAPVGIYQSNAEGTIIMANNSLAQILGYDSKEELIGKNLSRDLYIDPEERQRLIREYDTQEKGFASNLELKWKKKDGSPIWIILTAHAVKDASQETIYYEGFIADITQRKETTESLEQSENRYRIISSIASDYMFTSQVDSEGNLTLQWVAGAFEVITGYEVDEYVEQGGWRATLHPDDVKKDEEDMKKISSNQTVVTEIRTIKKKGDIAWVRVYAQPIWDKNQNRLSGIYGAVQDITERKLAEEATRQSEIKYRTLIDSMNEGLIQVDNNDEIKFVNDRFCEMLGYLREELIGKTGYDILMDEQYRNLVKQKNLLRAEGVSDNYEIQVKRKDGTYIWVLISGSSIMNIKKEVVGSLGVFTDITQQKLDIMALRESEERFHLMFERHNAIMFLIDPSDGKILDANTGAEKFYGYSISVLKTMCIEDINMLQDEEAIHFRERVVQNPLNSYVLQHRIASGELRTVELHPQPISIKGKIILFTVIHDVTERERAEIALKESNEKYKSFFDEDLTGDFIITPEGKILSCNPAFIRIFGISSIEEALTINFSNFYSSEDKFRNLINEVTQERKFDYHEVEMSRLDGKKLHIVKNIVGKFDSNGNLVEIKGYMFDDTKRHELEQQLIQSKKLEGLGTLAGGIAHDFNNILAIILGHSTLLEYIKDDPQKMKQSIDAVIKATERGAALVKQLLTFARKTETKLQAVQVNDILREVDKLLEETFPKTIIVTHSYSDSLPVITADSTQIHQVILNLCVNARDAMPRGGILSIATCVVAGKELLSQFPKAEERPYIEIIVCDDGMGMDDSTRQRIFEPFFTTKDIGKGTGLGLAMAFSIVNNHNGFIDVQSSPGKGTTVKVYFPAESNRTLSITPISQTMDSIPGGHETILFVEDEEFIRKLVVSVLESKGYNLIIAGDGKEALEKYQIHRQEINVVLSDVGLPLLGGDELFIRIKEIDPTATVILASGYINPDIRSLLEFAGAKHFIAKPYSHVELLIKLREVLDGV